MAIKENKHLVYSNISEKMRGELKTFFSSVETSTEIKRIQHIQSKWNAIINSGNYWLKVGQSELRDTPFIRQLKYDIRLETLKLGRKILKEAKYMNLKSKEAKRKQRMLVEELEDRLEYIAVRY